MTRRRSMEASNRRGKTAAARLFQDHPMVRQLPFVLVLVIAGVGGILIVLYHWREGTALVGTALLVAAVLRALLPAKRSGLLMVRGRAVDVLCYLGLGICILFVAWTLKAEPFS